MDVDPIDLSSEKIHLLIQFEHDLTEDEITELEQEGVKLLSNIPRKARYISVPVGKVNEISKKEYVRAVDVISFIKFAEAGLTMSI